ncbi:MAG: radical SAM protein, partial [Bacteroidales bacterium]
MSFLHHQIITGPIKSRRLGSSLGVNILPSNHKICNYNCIYCECGWAPAQENVQSMPKREQVAKALEKALKNAKLNHTHIDSITFSGNGESTIHPEFAEILNDTLRIRNQYLPDTKITIISNATKIGDKKVAEALHKADILM